MFASYLLKKFGEELKLGGDLGPLSFPGAGLRLLGGEPGGDLGALSFPGAGLRLLGGEPVCCVSLYPFL